MDATKPLNIVPSENMSLCVTHLIDYFGMFHTINEFDEKVKAINSEKNSLLGAYKYNFINKINKTKYKQNTMAINKISDELISIKTGLARRMCDINQILNSEIADLKIQKDYLINEKTIASNSLARIEKNINDATFEYTGEVARLKTFFPNIDENRLRKVESFHARISNILSAELEHSREIATSRLIEIEHKLNIINLEINKKIFSVTNASPLVDKIFEKSVEYDNFTRENYYYETEIRLKSEEKELKEALNTLKVDILREIQHSINTKIQDLVGLIYEEERQSPSLNLEPSKYAYKTIADTGTGKYYSNLILFDIAIFDLTTLPILIHDSVLFKNIENRAVDELIKLYIKNEKQSFISIDEITKYHSETQKILQENAALQLSNDKLLYIKDWRNKT